MGLLDIFRRRPPPEAPAPAAAPRRAYMAAAPSRLLADLPNGASQAPNRDIRMALSVLRARSRWLAQNDGYSKGFLRLLRRNVVGPTGFTLQMRVKNDRGDGMDRNANDRIEAAWAEWGRVGSCDVTGKMSFADFSRMLITSIGRDGEALVRMVPGGFNRFGMALQALDPSRLDENLNTSVPGSVVGNIRLGAGNLLRQGVETDRFGRPVAYWLKTTMPNDDIVTVPNRGRYERIPAEQMLHLFVVDWPDGQARGVPWLEAGVRALAMLDGYSEAELTAARVAAGKMGFYKLDSDAEDIDGELAEDGTLVQQAEAGSFELLPKGVEVEAFDPQHPNQAFKDFVSAILRQAAAGAGISYNAFANDAAGLNYSALRATELEDRDEWRTLQDWLIGCFAVPVFDAWLRRAFLMEAIGLPASKFFKFNAPNFIGRGWQWVDPQNEVKAAAEAVALGITSRTQIVAERGGDFEQIAAELAAEAAALPGAPLPGAAAATPASAAPGTA